MSCKEERRMAEAFKNYYNYDSIKKVALDIQTVYPQFEVDAYMDQTVDDSWEALELKDRVRRMALVLREFLPADYEEALGVIDQVVMKYGSWLEGFAWFATAFVEEHGLDDDHLEASIEAMKRYTQYASAEFAVRPFIIKHEALMMQHMLAWSKDDCEHVRRLSSEGCRPQLPWGVALNSFKKDPSPVLPILEQLKEDPSVWVRKSVANNLNDISKSHPELVVKIAREWLGKNKDTDWIVKHGCRTLLKQGNREALALFGFNDGASIEVDDFAVQTPTVALGDELSFSFSIAVAEDTKVRLEYGIDYVKANGKQSRKIFQLSESSFKAGTKKDYVRRHSFADVSTRKHYLGTHAVTLIVNGVERGTLEFELIA